MRERILEFFHPFVSHSL